MSKIDVTRAYTNMDGLYPAFRERVDKMLEQANRETTGKHADFVRWVVIETYRPAARQAYLYAQGRTREGNIVTWTLKSRHISGLAVDVAPLKKDGSIWWNAPQFIWDRLGHAARTQGLTWGGNWKKRDMPHVEASTAQFALWTVPARLYLKKKGLV